MAFIAGAFDHFRDAQAAADEMRHSGLAARDVRVTNNPANPDGVPCASVREEAEAFRGILEKLLSSLLDLDSTPQTRKDRVEEIRRGGVVVSASVSNDDDRSVVRAILYRRRAIELSDCRGGVPIY